MAGPGTRPRIEAEARVGAPAGEVYGLIADYRRHHHRFLPPAFSDWEVETGGVGAGTVVRFRLALAGRRREHRARIEEPEPGRRLVESDLTTGSVTTFEVAPEGGDSRVRITTELPGGRGLRGAITRRLAPRLLQPLYADELARLDRYAREQAAAANGAGDR